MPQNCCVPNCTKKKYRTESAEKISYFKFPDDTILKKCWLHAIRRDEGKEFRVSENTKICSRHFKPEDLVKAVGGQRVYVKAGGVQTRSCNNLKVKVKQLQMQLKQLLKPVLHRQLLVILMWKAA